MGLDQNHEQAKRNFSTAFERRIAANPQLYPAPFEGRWENLRGEDRKERYLADTIIPYEYEYADGPLVWSPYYRRYVPGPKVRVPRFKKEWRERTIPGTPAGSIVYVFNGSRVGGNSFYYTDNSLEFSTGRVVQF